MAVATEAQKRDIYFFCGWPQKNVQVNSALENSIARVAANDAQWAFVTNAANGSPPGLLACLWDQWAQVRAAQMRLMAVKVGSIELNASREIEMLRSAGRQLASALCSYLGVIKDADVFSPYGAVVAASSNMGMGMLPNGPGADNYIGRV